MRLLVVAFLAIAAAITVNALYFQDEPRLAASTVGSGTPRPNGTGKPPAHALPAVTAALPPKPTLPALEPQPSRPPADVPLARPAPPPEQPTPLVRSIQKKLARFGYRAVPQDGLASPDTRAAILAVEYEQGRPLSGEPAESILSALYFLEASGKTRLASAEGFERDPQLIQEVQDLLAKLGYTSGPVDGQLDAKTRDAIRRFEADRSLKPDGRLTERVILQMVIERGKPFLSKG